MAVINYDGYIHDNQQYFIQEPYWPDSSGTAWYFYICPHCQGWITRYASFHYCPYCGRELFPKADKKALILKRLDEILKEIEDIKKELSD